MSDAFAALRDGARRVNRAPAISFGVWMLTIVATLPPAAIVGGAIARDLGHSLAADAAAEGVNYEWMQEFSGRASGLAATLQPTVVGFGAVLDSLSALADNTPRPAAVVAIAAVYAAAWLFLAGGIIDRYARDRSTGVFGFFGACGVFFFRFIRLALVQGIVYGVLFAFMHPWLFGRIYPRMLAGVNDERTAFFARVVLYVVFGVLVAAANLVFDYAKVRAVVEDRHSMLGAIVNAVGFLRRNSSSAVALYALDVVAFVAVVFAYGLVAPGIGRGVLVWGAIAIAQLFVGARLWVKLLFWASETSLFQQRLAHAGYVARPEPVWPDSPAAEAITGSG